MQGAGKDYDCLLGISGGVDSSYLAYMARKLKLRPLVVHFDNGWDSELAVSNIQKIIEHLGFDLATYVIDWEEFRDLQRSFLKASVIDIEMLTDHAIFSALFGLARKHDIRCVLSGTNHATENGMPDSWVWDKQDLRNIKAIHNKYGSCPLQSFPTLNLWKWLGIRYLKLGFEFVELLNFANYKATEAITVLENELGWRYYGGKHYESIFTKFYQAYILPEKFGADKRKVHFSSLIRNGEMSRKNALIELNSKPYSPDELKNDKEYVLKKLSFSENEFDGLMKESPRPHSDFATDAPLVAMLRSFKKKLS
jgi:N-acetyl sugar amidotransferase